MAAVEFETTSGSQAKVNAGLAGVTAVSATRRGLVQQARKVLDETVELAVSLQAAATSASPASGELVVGLVGLLQGDVAAGLAFNLTKNAVTFTLFKVVVYDTAGNLVAVSADQSAAFNAGGNGKKEVAFSSAWTVSTSAAYYVGVVATVSAGTYSLSRGGATSLYGNTINGGKALIASQTGQTDAPSVATLANGNSTSAAYWFAVYK